MREGVHALDAAAHPLLRLMGQGPGDVVDAAHGGQDPQFVADAGAARFPGIAQERGGRFLFLPGMGRMVFIVPGAGQQGVQVMRVHVGTGGNILRGLADGEAVLDHRFPLGNVPKRRLVAHGQIGQQGDAAAFVMGGAAGGQGRQCHRYGIFFGDANQFVHAFAPYRQASKAAMAPCCRTVATPRITASSSPETAVRSRPHICSLVNTACTSASTLSPR